uniref:Uncharacterized protein n=1 Tax=Anguilla anguilla TaxID=7936 RepID=A0A0E9RCQ3_ANGAN
MVSISSATQASLEASVIIARLAAKRTNCYVDNFNVFQSSYLREHVTAHRHVRSGSNGVGSWTGNIFASKK